MELHADVEAVFRDLDDFDQCAVRGCAGDGQSCFHKGFAVGVAVFKAVPVPLGDLLCPIGFLHHGSRIDFAGVGAQTHGTALALHLCLLFHQVDDAVFAIFREFAAVCIRDPQDAAGVLDDGDLHAQANAKVGNVMFSCIAAGQDHALNAADAKAARDQDAVCFAQLLLQRVLRELLGIDPEHLHIGIIFIAAVVEGFPYGQIGVVQANVFSDDGDPSAAA